MRQFFNERSKNRIKKIASYLFLYVTFMCISFRFGCGLWKTAWPIGLLMLVIETLAYILFYHLVNYLIIRKIVGLKTIVIFETILLLACYVQFLCIIDVQNSWVKY